jgi:outer membrane lipase/esterase
MVRISARLLCAGAALVALTMGAAPASAQRVGRIVAFGDSYADTGNLFRLLGVAPPAVYANGRFSNGTNFVDTMSQILGVRDDNFAIGGAFTNNGNINGPGIPGFVTEYQSFLAGGGPASFPRVSGTFGPSDLLVLSIGGNDARAYEKSLGNTPTAAQITTLLAGVPGQATQKVAETKVGLDALVGAGARNITFLAGDTGRLPEVVGQPIAQVGTAYSTAFNSGMQPVLAGYASKGVIVNYLDLNKIGDQVAANLSAFGLQSAGACPTACVTTNPELLDKYLFYVDNLHLTSAGFAIVGKYAVRQLEAPLQFQAQTDAGLQAANGFAKLMGGRLDLSKARSGTEAADGGGIHFFVSGSTEHQRQRASNTSLDYTLDTSGVSGGAEYDMGPAVIGGAVQYSRPRADMNTGTGSIRATAWHVGAYAGFASGGAFLQGYAGYGWVDYRINRRAVIDDIHATPNGHNMLAGAKAGYLFDTGGFRVGPVAAVNYARTKINAYTETGDPVLTLNVQRQSVKAVTGSAGLELRGTMEMGGLAVRPYADVLAEKDFEGDGRIISYSETAAPVIVNSYALGNRTKRTYGRVTAGADFALGGAVSLQVQGSGSFERRGGNDLGGFAALKVGF